MPFEFGRLAFWTALIFSGGALGSFLCVCAVRLPAGISLIKRRSFCPLCEKPVAPRANVPALGFILCGGKCLQCGGRISFFYPAIETLCAASAALAFYTFGFSLEAVRCFIFLYGLIAVSVFDFTSMTAPDFITLPFASLGIVVSLPAGLLAESILGAACGGGALLAAAAGYKAVRKKDGMGMGDVKFTAGIGAFLGPGAALLTISAACVVGTVGGLAYLKILGKGFHEPFPFAPFIAASAAAVFFFY